MDSVLGPKSLHELETVMGNSCDFRNCRTASIMQTVHKIILTLKFFQDKVNKATLTFFVQALLFGVPVKKLGGAAELRCAIFVGRSWRGLSEPLQNWHGAIPDLQAPRQRYCRC